MHLAAENVQGRWTDAKKRAIRDSRELGHAQPRGRPAGRAARRPGCSSRRARSASTAAAATRRSPRTPPPGDDFLADVARAWEAEAERATTGGIRVVVLRNGIVLGRDGGALQRMLLPAKLGANGPLGGGRQWWSWIHMDDTLGLFRHALEQDDVAGPLNGTAPHPHAPAGLRAGPRARAAPPVVPARAHLRAAPRLRRVRQRRSSARSGCSRGARRRAATASGTRSSRRPCATCCSDRPRAAARRRRLRARGGAALPAPAGGRLPVLRRRRQPGAHHAALAALPHRRGAGRAAASAR